MRKATPSQTTLQVAVWLCIALLFAVPAEASRDFLISRWQTEHGLPQNTVQAILQTRDGYLWLGTHHGLARFDGFSFRVFNRANTPDLISERISALFQDSEGVLWVGTEGGGVTRISGSKVESLSIAHGLSSEMVTCIAEDGSKTIWVGTSFGLNRWRGDRFTSFTMGEAFPGNEIAALVTDPAGTLWIATDQGLVRYANGQFQVIGSIGVAIKTLAIGTANTLWVGTAGDGLLLLRTDTLEVAQQHLLPEEFTAIATINHGDLLVASTQHGLQRLSAEGIEQIATPFPNSSIECLYQDNDGNIWIGSTGAGLAMLKKAPLSVYTTSDGLPVDQIDALILGRNGRIFAAGQSGGAVYFDGETFVPIGEDPFRNQSILALCAASDGSCWVGTRGNGLHQIKNGIFTMPPVTREAMAAIVTAIFEDADGGLWIGTEAEGVIHLKGNQISRLTTREGLSENQALSIVQGRDGAIWMGTANAGLNRILNGKIRSFSTKDGLGSDSIRCLYMDRLGMLWVGTSAGLSMYWEDNWFTFTTRHGLADDVISQVIEDDYGNLWIGSNRGIFRVSRNELLMVAGGDQNTLTCVSYGVADGMLSAESIGGRQSTALKDTEGNLWFSTTRGLVRILANELRHQQPPPRVMIQRVLLNDETIVSDSFFGSAEDVESVRLPSGGAKLEIHFAALSLAAPEKLRFRYRLEGFDRDWIHVGANRSALYTMLPHGEYLFRVTAYDQHGRWNNEGALLRVIVVPKYWETFAFKAAIGGLVCLGFAGLVHLKRARRREVEALRLRIAGDLHDELGSNLSSIALLSRRVGKNADLPKQQKAELEEIQTIATQTTNAVRDIVWFIDPKNDTLEGMVKRMREVASLMLAEVEHEFTAIGISNTDISPEFRRNVFLVFKEALNNLVRHSGATHASIQIKERNRFLEIVIRDNGCGCDDSARHRGNGFRNMSARAAHLGGELRVNTSPGKGLEIQFSAKIS